MHKLLRVCWRRWVTANGVRCSSIKSNPHKLKQSKIKLYLFYDLFLFPYTLLPSYLYEWGTATSYTPLYKPTNKETSHLYPLSLLSLSLLHIHTIHLGGEKWGWNKWTIYISIYTQKYFNILLRPHHPPCPKSSYFQYPPMLKTTNLTQIHEPSSSSSICQTYIIYNIWF